MCVWGGGGGIVGNISKGGGEEGRGGGVVYSVNTLLETLSIVEHGSFTDGFTL